MTFPLWTHFRKIICVVLQIFHDNLSVLVANNFFYKNLSSNKGMLVDDY